MKNIISTDKAPAAIGPYSQGVCAQLKSITITSGQLPIDPATGAFAEGGIAGQTRQSLENVRLCWRPAASPWRTSSRPPCSSRI